MCMQYLAMLYICMQQSIALINMDIYDVDYQAIIYLRDQASPKTITRSKLVEAKNYFKTENSVIF